MNALLRIVAAAFVWLATAALLPGCASNWKTEISTYQPVPGVNVTIQHAQGAFWLLTATNQASSTVLLNWDESAYVSTTGVSSRLVRGKTRVLHSGQAQPSAPIPPGATISEYVIAESQIDAAKTGIMPPPGDPTKPGRFVLTFEINDRKQTYEARVLYSQPQSDR